MTRKTGIEPSPTKEGSTEFKPAGALTPGDEIQLTDGQFATVEDVQLFPRDRSMRGRKLLKCRIHVTIPSQSGFSCRRVTAYQGDLFTKLVGVRQK